MKLNKIYSPFFLLIIAILVTACYDNKNHNINTNSYVNNGVSKDKADSINRAIETYKSALVFDSKNENDSAFYKFNAAKNVLLYLKDYGLASFCLIKMAQIQNVSGDYFGSEETLVEALPYIKDSINYRREVYNLLGISYRRHLDYGKAIEYYNKASFIAKDSLHLCIIKNNFASVIADEGNYDAALSILLNLNQLKVVNEDAPTKARILSSIGEIYLKLDKPIAISYLNEALKIRIALNNPKDLASIFLKLSEFYRLSDKSESKIYGLKAEKMAYAIDNVDGRLQALQILSSITDGSEYRVYTNKYIKLQDSINNVRKKAKSFFAAIKYDAKTAEAENLKLKAQQAQDRLQAQKDKLYKIVTTSAIMIGGLFIYILILRHRKEKSLQVYNTETRISKKIHDELANDVFKVMSFAESQDFSLPLQQQKLVQNLDSIYNKTRDISRENNTIDTGENYGLVLTEMLADYKTESTNVMTVNFEAVNWDKIAAHKKITVYRILQELMVNMKKHSYASIVALKFDKDDKKISIQYTDNGRGLSIEKTIYKNGLQNAETRILSVGGSITFESEPNRGLKAIIIVPV
jgi:signal transduction histidine kinase